MQLYLPPPSASHIAPVYKAEEIREGSQECEFLYSQEASTEVRNFPSPRLFEAQSHSMTFKYENGALVFAISYNAETFTFDNLVFVRLRKPVTFSIMPDYLINSDWDIKMPYSSEIAGELARKFSMLSNKASSDNLSSEDKVVWKNIIPYIDYNQYQFDNCSPTYIEGRVVKIQPNKITIRRIDEHFEYIVGKAIKNCVSLKAGDWFYAYVKYDSSYEINHIERIGLTGDPKESNFSLSDIPVEKV